MLWYLLLLVVLVVVCVVVVGYMIGHVTTNAIIAVQDVIDSTEELACKNISIDMDWGDVVGAQVDSHGMYILNEYIPMFNVIRINPVTTLQVIKTIGLRYRELYTVSVMLLEHELGHIIADNIMTGPSMANEIDAWDYGAGSSGVVYDKKIYEKVRKFALSTYDSIEEDLLIIK